jgi:ABC-type branched-subunit amino acid transport system substrate-binding protein
MHPVRTTALFALTLSLGLGSGCEAPPQDDPIQIGLLLSYTGSLASNSVNSERALLMAIEAANQAGGIDGRRVGILARDTRSDPRKILTPTQELLDAKAAVLIGPDYNDLLSQAREILEHRTLILPSFATASNDWKPPSWFSMGAGFLRVACELVTQYQSEGLGTGIQIIGPSDYNSALSWEFSNAYGLVKHVLSTDQSSTTTTVQALTRAMAGADAYLLAASPDTASSLIYALAAIGELKDPTRWFLSPTLHTPAFLESIPKGVLNGARGVSSGTVAGAADFRALFKARWHDSPLDDAYPFYDAGAIAVLAIQRALRDDPAHLAATGLAPEHVIAVTKAGGLSVKWNELDKGLQLLREGQEIEYFGLTGQLQFDVTGKSLTASTNWWTITGDAFVDIPHKTDCR